MADNARTAEQTLLQRWLQKFFKNSTDWRGEALRVGNALFGVGFLIAVFLAALEIHWALHEAFHRLFGA